MRAVRSEKARASEQYLDWTNLVLGGLLFISPWVLGFANADPASWHAWIAGIAVAVLAIAALTRFSQWEEWIESLVGVWLVISPWVLGFNEVVAATWTHVVLGVLVAVIAASRGWRARTTHVPA